jgi:hypothetical protein
MGLLDMFGWINSSKPSQGSANNYSEIGVTGVRVASGFIYEEFLQELTGAKGLKVLREMSDNDATVGAIITAIDALLRAIKWRVEPNPLDPSGTGALFVDDVMTSMDTSWESFISELLTMLTFGYSYFEIVYKKRDDGNIGIKKFSPRAQESLLRWELSPKNEVLGFHQQDPNAGGTWFIPREKALHFRTTSRKDNPEGRSIIRNAYVSWYYKKQLQIIEAIAIERELAGLPVVRIPSEILTNKENAATLAMYTKMARDLKFNDQGGIVLPSDCYKDENGRSSNVPMFEVSLVSSSGSRSIDINAAITRYEQDMARTILADFLILGSSSRGSFALSKSKTDLFLRSLEGFTAAIAAELNNDFLPKLWKINGMSPDTMPVIKPGQVAPTDLVELGLYVQQMAQAGIPLAGDPEIERKLRQAADLPADYLGDTAQENLDETTVAETPDAMDGPSSGNI